MLNVLMYSMVQYSPIDASVVGSITSLFLRLRFLLCLLVGDVFPFLGH